METLQIYTYKLLVFKLMALYMLFPFERLNGILGSYHNNKKSISVQVMQHITREQVCGIYNWPSQLKNDFAKLLYDIDYCKGSQHWSSLQLL